MPQDVQEVASAFGQLGPLSGEQKDKAVDAVQQAAIRGPSRKTTDVLWLILVGGLVAIAAGALAALAFDDATTPDNVITIFSSTLTGLIGLFVKSPFDAIQAGLFGGGGPGPGPAPAPGPAPGP
jgi:hypothetical protein